MTTFVSLSGLFSSLKDVVLCLILIDSPFLELQDRNLSFEWKLCIEEKVCWK